MGVFSNLFKWAGGEVGNSWGPTETAGEKDSPFADEWKRIGGAGWDSAGYGRGLTDEGIGGLRDLRRMAGERYKDPLGDVGRGIFARARGAVSDTYARNVNAGDARRRQLATQTGGSLTPEQIAALDEDSRRSAAEQKFAAENELAVGEGQLAFSEMGKFFDRMADIDKSIAGVGQNERWQGLNAMIQAVLGRQDRIDKAVGHVLGPWG